MPHNRKECRNKKNIHVHPDAAPADQVSMLCSTTLSLAITNSCKVLAKNQMREGGNPFLSILKLNVRKGEGT